MSPCMQCAVRASAPYSNSSIFMYTKHKYEYILHFEYSIYPPPLIVAFDLKVMTRSLWL